MSSTIISKWTVYFFWGSSSRSGISLQTGSKRCLFSSAASPRLSKVCKVSIETKVAPISLPLFRICFSTQSVYKVHKSFNCYSKNIKYFADSLLRRHSANCEILKGIDYGKGYIDFWEISAAAQLEDRIFGDSCELQRYGTRSSTRESKWNNRSVPVVSLKRSSDSAGDYSTD